MPKQKKMSIRDFMKNFSTNEACYSHLEKSRWSQGFVCPKCGGSKYCKLSNGRYQCSKCHRQTSVTANTFLHRSHVSLVKWFLAIYFVTNDKRGISAVQLASTVGVTYKTAWYMLKRIRTAMGERDKQHFLSGIIEFDDTYIGGPEAGSKRGRGTTKAKVFVALSLNEIGCPQYLKMGVTENLKQKTVQKFAKMSFSKGSIIHSDGYRSYIPALKDDFDHQHKVYDPNGSELKWLHTLVSNAKAFILGTYHGLPKKHLQSYLDEFCYRFSRRHFGANLFERLTIALVATPTADSKG